MSFLERDFGILPSEDTGVWIDFRPNPDGSIPRIKIRRAHARHRKYQAALAEILQDAKDVNAFDGSDDETFPDLYGKHIVLDWENIICPEDLADKFGLQAGERIPYSVDNAIKLLRNRLRLLDHLYVRANRQELFAAKADEDTVKN